MSDATPRLALPYLLPAQAQKHVTHNEALRLLDASVQLSVEGFGQTVPPALPAEGEAHALGAGATGDWAGQDGRIAVWSEAAWLFVPPQEGWRAWGKAEAQLRVWTGADWAPVAPDSDLEGLGIGTGWDAVNRLSVASAASLFSHEGAGHQVKVNKAAPAETASLLFQSGWSGRAEMGLAGSDDFAVKVSPDGASWQTAMSVEPATGLARFPAGVNSGAVALGDDSAHAIPIASAAGVGGLIFVFVDSPNFPQPGAYGAMWFDVGGSLSSYPMSLGSLCDIATGPLAGTTGTDGVMTLSADTGQIVIENRLGGSREFRWFLVS